MSASSPRITARVSVDIQELLSKATALSGVSSINSFVVNAAIEKANRVIEQQQTINLSSHDTQLLLDALDRPARVNKNLVDAYQRYKEIFK